MSIEIRPVETLAEYRAVEELQRAVWNLEDIRITPDHILLTVQKNGGVVLGAFDPDADELSSHLVGFVYGLVGLQPDGRLKHCSMQLGVRPEYQNQQVGYRLKLAQRTYVLAQGIDLITWTYDPLESRNAYLNLHKLGAVCTTYLRNLYGPMRDRLNSGLPSDRFQVDWYIASSHVVDSVEGRTQSAGRGNVRATDAPLLNAEPSGGVQLEARSALLTNNHYVLIEVPARFQELKAADIRQAQVWREQTRELFEMAFAVGYTAVDLLVQGERRYYVLEKDWRPM